MTVRQKLTDERIGAIEFGYSNLADIDECPFLMVGDVRDMLAELRHYRAQVATEKADELTELVARNGLTGKIEHLARALATTTARYGKVVPERQTIAISFTVFTIIERGFKAIRDADELAMARVVKNLEALPTPDEIERYISQQDNQKPKEPK